MDTCAYCQREVVDAPVPDAHDDAGWAEAGKGHADGCEWVWTRGHRIMSWIEHRESQRADTSAWLQRALVAHGWSLSRSAAAIGVAVGTLQDLIRTHGLTEVYAEHSPGRGRPRKARP